MMRQQRANARLFLASIVLLAQTAAVQLSPSACDTTLRRLCVPQHSSSPTPCNICAGLNQHSLRIVGCSAADVQAFCANARHPPVLYKGVDLSYCAQAEATGTRYYARVGDVASDPIRIVAENGANIARLRLWVDPPYPNQTYVPSPIVVCYAAQALSQWINCPTLGFRGQVREHYECARSGEKSA
jgi:hypothetical protein